VKCPNFHWIMHRNRDRMRRWAFVPEPHMTALLSNDLVPKVVQRPNQAIAGNIAWKFHAASNGINSSFT
jgi:hypothetical protein